MNFTQAFYQLHTFYKNTNSEVLKRDAFIYHNHKITLWYLEEHGFSIIQIEIMNNDSIVFINSPIAYYNGEYHIDLWVPEKEYNALKYSLFKNDGWSPAPVYNHIVDVIKKDNISSYTNSTKNNLYIELQKSSYRTISEENLIYFSHLRTSNVGIKIKRRLQRMMSFSEAQLLIDKLEKINKTLVFTDNPIESRDLYIAIAEEEQYVSLKN